MRHLTAREVAERAKLNLRTVKRYAANGTLPVAEKLPGTTGPYLFDAEAIDEWIAERAAGARA